MNKHWWTDVGIPEDLARKVFRVEYEGPEGSLQHDIRPDLSIDDDLLEIQIARAPAARQFFGGIYAAARRNVTLFERMLIERRAKARQEVFEEGIKNGANPGKGGFTDSFLNAMVECDEEVCRLEIEKIEAWRVVNVLDSLIKTMDSRMDLMRTLAAFKREEFRRTS